MYNSAKLPEQKASPSPVIVLASMFTKKLPSLRYDMGFSFIERQQMFSMNFVIILCSASSSDILDCEVILMCQVSDTYKTILHVITIEDCNRTQAFPRCIFRTTFDIFGITNGYSTLHERRDFSVDGFFSVLT